MDTYKVFELENYTDSRGETIINFDLALGKQFDFNIEQVNTGFSIDAYTLRGLHFQPDPYAQAKIVYCLKGSIYSVAVDLRKSSPMYGAAVASVLSAENHKAMYLPRGFAHGYVTLEPNTLMQWCVDNHFKKGSMQCVNWKSCNIKWPGNPDEYIINERDANAPMLDELIK